MKRSDLKVGCWNERNRLESLKILSHLLLFKFPRSSFRREAGAVCRNFCYNPSKNNVVKVGLPKLQQKCLLCDFQQLHTSYLFQCSPQTAPSPLYYTSWVLLRSTAQATHPGPVLTSPAFQVSAEIANCGQNGWADPKYPADNSVMWVFKLFWFLSCLCKLRQMLQKWREIYFPYFVLYLLHFVFCWNTVARGRLDFTTSSAKTICFIILHQYWSVLPLLSIGKHILHGVSDTLNLQSGISLTRTKYVETKIKVHTFSCLYLLCESQEDGQWNWHWRSVVVSTHKKNNNIYFKQKCPKHFNSLLPFYRSRGCVWSA